jgi:hypothetical protein
MRSGGRLALLCARRTRTVWDARREFVWASGRKKAEQMGGSAERGRAREGARR